MRVVFSNEPFVASDNSIFLAGPTHRVKLYKDSWRMEAVGYLEEMGFDGIVYIPDFEETNLSITEIEEQMDWEYKAMWEAGVILFWIPRNIKEDMPAFTSNIEFGMYMEGRPRAVVYGRPDNAEKMEYLDWLYKKIKGKDAVIQNNLKEVCKQAMISLETNIKCETQILTDLM